MDYRILKTVDVELDRDELLTLMEIVLADNITQSYPPNQAEIYVDRISGYIGDGSAVVSAAFDNSRIVGFCWAYELSIFGERRIHIDMIGVNPEYRKQGIARRLVDLQIEELKS